MNYLQVKLVSKILEEKIKHIQQFENIQSFKEYSKEDKILLEEFLKEIQQINLK